MGLTGSWILHDPIRNGAACSFRHIDGFDEYLIDSSCTNSVLHVLVVVEWREVLLRLSLKGKVNSGAPTPWFSLQVVPPNTDVMHDLRLRLGADTACGNSQSAGMCEFIRCRWLAGISGCILFEIAKWCSLKYNHTVNAVLFHLL